MDVHYAIRHLMDIHYVTENNIFSEFEGKKNI